jgi:hypothetical protein
VAARYTEGMATALREEAAATSAALASTCTPGAVLLRLLEALLPSLPPDTLEHIAVHMGLGAPLEPDVSAKVDAASERLDCRCAYADDLDSMPKALHALLFPDLASLSQLPGSCHTSLDFLRGMEVGGRPATGSVGGGATAPVLQVRGHCREHVVLTHPCAHSAGVGIASACSVGHCSRHSGLKCLYERDGGGCLPSLAPCLWLPTAMLAVQLVVGGATSGHAEWHMGVGVQVTGYGAQLWVDGLGVLGCYMGGRVGVLTFGSA